MNIYTKIVASGSYIPETIVKNTDFLKNEFYDSKGEKILKSNDEITKKLEEITGIKERRYVGDDLVSSDIALIAAENAITSSDYDRETLDYIIVAHNFGDLQHNNRRSDFVPSLAARVKQRLKIANPSCVAYDLAFGCPGWLMGVIQANSFIKSGIAKRALVIGSETLSRISDPADIDSMIYSDGAGAVILEAVESDKPVGIISQGVRSDTLDHAQLLHMNESYNPGLNGGDIFLKMEGHKLYKYAIQTVPLVIKECIEKVNVKLTDINKVFIHQANEKLDIEILNRLFDIYGLKDLFTQNMDEILPMTISWLGNSSVATIPTLYDFFMKGKLEGHSPVENGLYLFASVGAGMNVNCMLYRTP